MTAAERERFEVLLEDIQRGVRVIAEAQVAVTERLDHMQTEFGARFDALESRFGAMEIRFGALEKRVAVQASRLERVELRLDRIEPRLERIEGHFGLNGAATKRKRR